jgi:hypothetical protein
MLNISHPVNISCSSLKIADPVEIREGDYVLLEFPDLGLGAGTKDSNAS